jgi:hypothetical protein
MVILFPTLTPRDTFITKVLDEHFVKYATCAMFLLWLRSAVLRLFRDVFYPPAEVETGSQRNQSPSMEVPLLWHTEPEVPKEFYDPSIESASLLPVEEGEHSVV